MKYRKSTTEKEMIAFLEKDLQFPPLQVADVQPQSLLAEKGMQANPDALLTLRLGQKTYCFAVEAKRLWTPKVVAMAVDQARRYAALAGVNPLILVPYLGEEWLLKLEAQGVSGIDLCGNGVVIVPEELLILRTGFPNRFRWEGAIKNVYRKNSSVVARVFLLVGQFDSVNEALAEIRRRGGEVAIATVSKVCKSLGDDLVIERSGAAASVAPRLRLLQPEKLLDLLAENYVPPRVSRMFQGKCGLRPGDLCERLAQGEAGRGVRAVLTGVSSVEAYAVMAREPLQSFYCTDIDKIIASFGEDIRETDRFANVSFQETRDDFVYFDRRAGLVASPIQSYLELVKGDKREKETADQVRRVILGQPTRASRGEK
jgi:hypothetical protein